MIGFCVDVGSLLDEAGALEDSAEGARRVTAVGALRRAADSVPGSSATRRIGEHGAALDQRIQLWVRDAEWMGDQVRANAREYSARDRESGRLIAGMLGL